MSQFIPSEEQQAIFTAHANSRGNIAINALAGTGKTTTLVELAKTLSAGQSKVYCAFNTAIADDVRPRLEGTGMSSRTFHSLGRGALLKHLNVKDFDLQTDKYREIVKSWAEGSKDLAGAIQLEVQHEGDHLTPDEREELAAQYMKDTIKLGVGLAQYLRLKLVEWADEYALHSLVVTEDLDETYSDAIITTVVEAIPGIMEIAEADVKERARIDFTDMIYWCVRWNVRMFQFMHVFVDECQDLSPMQRAMVDKIIWRGGGRVVLVGDPNQAIYAFAGADSDSFDLSVAQWNAQVLPLTVTRRCAQVIARHAAQLVPDFKCLNTAPQGEIVYVPQERMTSEAVPGDMILCRLNSPLVAACLDFIAAGVPATVLGKGIGKALIAILEKVEALKGYTWATLGDKLTEHEDRVIAKRMSKNDEGGAEAYRDQCAAVRVVIERFRDEYQQGDMNMLKSYIEDLFSDETSGSVVTLSTVHKAKGREADRVWILAPERLPLDFDWMSEEARQQERNLDYVARTRAKKTLGYFTNKQFKAPPQVEPSEVKIEAEQPPALPESEPQPVAAQDNGRHIDPDTGEIVSSPQEIEASREEWAALMDAHKESPAPAFRATGDLQADLKTASQTPRQRLETKVAALSEAQVAAVLAMLEAFN